MGVPKTASHFADNAGTILSALSPTGKYSKAAFKLILEWQRPKNDSGKSYVICCEIQSTHELSQTLTVDSRLADPLMGVSKRQSGISVAKNIMAKPDAERLGPLWPSNSF